MSQLILSFFLPLLLVSTTTSAAPQNLRLQPELDIVDVEIYIKNPSLFAIQLKCVMNDGPCDAVGRFLKPRVAHLLLGECEFCTPKQVKDINRIITFIQDEQPELYRMLITKFISDAGIKIPSGNDDKKSEDSNDSQKPGADNELSVKPSA